ncbi:hypothetical protein C2W62_09255 [Candidatus Entotheonella serta]|nr:hypothetical protein C2W62_09255 [Candidatus Entotheonella serta]
MAQELTNTQQLRDLSVRHHRRGEAFTAQARYADALDAYQTSMSSVERLVTQEPHNADWQQALAVSCERVGDARTTRGRPRILPLRFIGSPEARGPAPQLFAVAARCGDSAQSRWRYAARS